jgi:hypothetical protein
MRCGGDLLPNALMWSCSVEVGHIRIQNALELPLMQDQQMIETLLPDAPGRTAHRPHWLGARGRVF